MKTYEATEQAYKNGYAKGYEAGKRDALITVKNITENTVDALMKIGEITHGEDEINAHK